MSRRIGTVDHNPSHGSRGRRPVRRIQDHSDTQRSLQEASVALENAFDRIRHVRRNLLRLTESLPEPLTGSSNSGQDSVDPGHEALLLSGGTTEERQQDDSSHVALGTREVDGAAGTPPRSPSPTRLHSAVTLDPPTLIQAPPLPSVLPPRFSRQSLYGLSPDSAATTHGLRVAAREAANSTANNNLRVFGITPRDSRSDPLELERLLARGHIGYGAAQDPPIPDEFRFHPARRGRPSHLSAVVPPVFPASAPPNAYQYRFNTLIPTPDTSNRMNYLPLPPAPPPGRPIQWPISDSPGPPRPRLSTTNVASSDESDDENLSEYQFISWLFPSQEYATSLVPRRDPHNPETIRITRADEPTPSHPDLEPRRRRGWGEFFLHTKPYDDLGNLHWSTLARLDPDGNEISWDEEEELERSRTEYRLRVLQSTHEGSNGPEILRHDGRTFHGSVLDSMLSVPATLPRTDQWRSATTTDTQIRPFWVDPLPMPLSSMIRKEENQDDCHPDVIVPRHACLAGR
jgi:hypothetical protein